MCPPLQHICVLNLVVFPCEAKVLFEMIILRIIAYAHSKHDRKRYNQGHSMTDFTD